MAFDLHSEHFDSILNIPTELELFELYSRANTLGMCKNHSMYVRRGEFQVFEQHSFYDDPARMWLEFSKFFIPADSGSFRLRVTGALTTIDIIQMYENVNL